MDYLAIIEKYYPEDNELRRLLLRHSRDVADLALKLVDVNKVLNLDRDFVEEAAMLHDIGIFMTDAPGIHCFGTHAYIQHGVDGAALLRKEGFARHARVCERHTGTGLTLDIIERENLPLPKRDLAPETLEEQLVCYADKFFSKSRPEIKKTPEMVVKSLSKFGQDSVAKFLAWHKFFSEDEHVTVHHTH